MLYCQDGSLQQIRSSKVRSTSTMCPISSRSSSASAAEHTLHSTSTLPSALPTSSSCASRPTSPGLQITQLLHQTANLLAVNAQLRKEIEQVRSGVNVNLAPSGATSATPSTTSIPTPSNCIPQLQQQKFIPFISLSGSSVTFDCEMPYGHDTHHHNNQHNSRPATGKKAVNPDSYKTVMCQAWLESKMCAFGENCRFAHGEAELRPVRSVPCQINKYKTKLCDKYTTTGLCPYGDRCLFIHPDHGTNAYIRPDKLVEVSRRHALADMQFLASLDPARAITPPTVPYVPGHPAMTQMVPPPAFQSNLPPSAKTLYNCGSVPFGNCGNNVNSGQTRSQLRPHPSWPLEPSTFFREKTDEFRTPSPADGPLGGVKDSWEQLSTPARSSSGYISGGSTPSGTSPFSTVSSSSLHLNLTDDDRDFDIFNLTIGLDQIAKDLAKKLELW